MYEKQSQLHTMQNQSNCLIFCPINCISRHTRWKYFFSLQPMTAWLKFWLKLIKHHDIKDIITDGEFVGKNVKHQMIVIIAPLFVIGKRIHQQPMCIPNQEELQVERVKWCLNGDTDLWFSCVSVLSQTILHHNDRTVC